MKKPEYMIGKIRIIILLIMAVTISLIVISTGCGIAGEAPTIRLEQYFGPDYSQTDGMCHYRVLARTTGYPNPEITFAGDDNLDRISSGIVEISVQSGDTYTLTATAFNKNGQASDSITLKGECGAEIAAEADNIDPGGNNTAEAETLKHDIISPPTTAPEIRLTDHNGKLFQLSSLRGKVVLVFFGFSHCYGACPVVLSLINNAYEKMGSASEDVVVVMVSTDPENDTPGSMKEYMSGYNSDFLGLLGSYDELSQIWDAYGVTVHGQEHSSLTYVIDKKGMLRETFLMIASSDDIADDIRLLLQEN